MGEGDESGPRKGGIRRGDGDGAVGEGRRRRGAGRRSGVQPADVLGAFGLVVGAVLGVGPWRTYLAQSAAGEAPGEGGDGDAVSGARMRALVKPREVFRPDVAAAADPA